MQLRRTNQYTYESRVRYSETDLERKLTIPAIINYFQDASTFQSESFGLGIEYCQEHKKAWFLSSWQIVVERYPELGEPMDISTWSTGFKGMFGDRNFILEDKEGNILAWANSLWIYMDLEKGRPTKPSKEDIEKYGATEPLERELAPRKIDMPSADISFEVMVPVKVMKYHIDTNGHMNNCHYVSVAMEVLDDAQKFTRVRVEYKKSAVYGDMIVPKVAKEDDRTVVVLCNEGGKEFAVIEFK